MKRFVGLFVWLFAVVVVLAVAGQANAWPRQRVVFQRRQAIVVHQPQAIVVRQRAQAIVVPRHQFVAPAVIVPHHAPQAIIISP